MKNLHKRSKMGQLPGDIPKRAKIAMLEKGSASISYGGGYVQHCNSKAGKSFKAIIRARERARMKERIRERICQELV